MKSGGWFAKRLPLQAWWERHGIGYYLPKDLNLWYCFGACLIAVLVLQFLSGIVLSQFYSPSPSEAFDSVQKIMRDVPWGWFFRYMHTTGASFCFIFLYLHLFRGLLYGSYQAPRELLWLLGMGLFFVLMLEAFFGYLLPWGQMSYWGAQVITSILAAIPGIGPDLVLWIRGDYVVGAATLHRFFAWHIILLPLILLILVALHLMALRQVGPTHPKGKDLPFPLEKGAETRPFHPFYTVKDALVLSVVFALFAICIFYFPSGGGLFIEANNLQPADPLQTPSDLLPVWYLTPFYAILRIIPQKGLGILILFFILLLPCLLPFLDRSVNKSLFLKSFLFRCFFVLGIAGFVLLGILGRYPLSPGLIFLSRLALIMYCAYFIFMPWYSRFASGKL